ncbi:UNVERIFIED_CONTAM: hypothetical protein FKN15_016564 [Acipenser sinensis]
MEAEPAGMLPLLVAAMEAEPAGTHPLLAEVGPAGTLTLLAEHCLSEETVTQQRAGSVESEQLTAGPDLQEAEVGGVSGCSSTRVRYGLHRN